MRMCYCVALLAMGLCVGLVATCLFGQSEPGEESMEKESEALEYKGADGATLLYRLLKPAGCDVADKRHPLLLFLHGAGERGSDNKAQLVWGKEMMRTAAERYGAFVLLPQCPEGQWWVEITRGKPTRPAPEKGPGPMRLVLELIAKIRKQYRIDPDRLYVVGLSMGGYGAWDLIQRQPEMFAAAVPICGGGNKENAKRIKTPVWAFHGEDDSVVPVSRSTDMIEAMKAAGAKPKYTQYPGVGHNSWSPAFKDPEMLKWLFGQRRSGKE